MANEIALQFKEFVGQLETSDSVQRLAAKHLTPERISSLLLTEAVKTPALYDTMTSQRGRDSIVNFYILANQIGLEPGSAMGLLYSVPKRIKGTWCILPIIGYKGYCELARRSGEIKRINAEVFYQVEVNKHLIRIKREPPDVNHNWDPTIEYDDKDLVGAYAVVELKDGGKHVLVMNRKQLLARAQRGGSFNSSYSPWKSDFAAMCRKTVLRALLTDGTVPMNSEARQALAEDGDAIQFQSAEPAGEVVIDPEHGAVDAQTGEVLETQTSGQDKLKEALGMDNGSPATIDAEWREVPPNPFQ
jgi:recombination protein RecT